ncbi:MAG: site-specific integrase [Campylobacterota bacterium]|nr:site-specific integrase [Campylobacterota bacterium]
MAKKLLEIMRDKIRFKHYSIRTEQVYIHWAKRYILFVLVPAGLHHNKRHPKDMGKVEIEQFLTNLATVQKVSPTTHTTKS